MPHILNRARLLGRLLGPTFFLLAAAPAGSMDISHATFLADEKTLNLYCLRAAYPQIVNGGGQNAHELVLEAGKVIPYDKGESSIAAAMAQDYALEPTRPETGPGYAPGRKRPYALFDGIYGSDPGAVGRHLHSTSFLGRKITLTAAASRAWAAAQKELEPLAVSHREWLMPAGGYNWRKIAGENVLSAHAYGIAVDLGAKKAPYWRWSKVFPHPLQKTYPAAIVEIMERHGFIWGGKWHEYDLMHFEYRPELLCKARMKRLIRPAPDRGSR